jgi:hypothetical protein|tara:strand:+ start:402 stop:809 length:408 start_codon:yes stop_codon:yes gene_type:complete
MSYKSELRSILRFDMIRLLKLLEIAQFTILAALSAMLLGPVINEKSPNVTDNNIAILFIEVLVEIGFLGIFIYYIRKIILLIPFFFSWVTKKYIHNRKGSALLAIGVGMGLIFNRTQTKLFKKIGILSSYLTTSL